MEDVGALRLRVADLVYGLHVMTSVFVSIAWAMPWDGVLWFALFFIPAMVLHWQVADVCILRTWEMALRGHPDAGSVDQGSFLVSLFGLVGITITFATASKLSYAISYASLAGCALRLFVLG
jgi:hypothetical protein